MELISKGAALAFAAVLFCVAVVFLLIGAARVDRLYSQLCQKQEAIVYISYGS